MDDRLLLGLRENCSNAERQLVSEGGVGIGLGGGGGGGVGVRRM